MSRAEKKLRAAARRERQARVVVQTGARAAQVMEQMHRELETLREVQTRFRHVLFGAFMARGLGEESKLSDAILEAWPEWFKGKESTPWMAFSER